MRYEVDQDTVPAWLPADELAAMLLEVASIDQGEHDELWWPLLLPADQPPVPVVISLGQMGNQVLHEYSFTTYVKFKKVAG